MRCVHLNRAGRQCGNQALEGGQFCALHSPMLENDNPQNRVSALEDDADSGAHFPLVYRLAALALLLLFLLQGYQAIRSWLH